MLFGTPDYVVEKIKELSRKEFVKEAYLKFDNFIIHVGAEDLEKAEKLLKIARDLGLKSTVGGVEIEPFK